MALQQGQTLAHYRLQEKIGEGGMGEVYRATDTRLGRDVAIKTLPEGLAQDAERLARFQREAQLLASLNHPNIASIHGIEEADGTPFLVLELIEGEDLSGLIRQGPPAIEAALALAGQIAAALEEAHERGVIHRDLKPANIKVTPGGRIKVLDFGLARAFEASPGAAASSSISLSPTMTAAATRAGIILGTAAYMSPEQARGATVDKRADIWSFGVVLLEMLTGHSAFSEPTVSDTLASVLKSEPDWKGLPASTPPPLRRLLRRCLTKDPARRLRDIGEARIVIEAIARGESEPEVVSPEAAAAAPRAARWGWITAGAVAVTAAVTLFTARSFNPPAPIGPVKRFEIASGGILVDEPDAPAISPDGNTIVFVREDGLWIRRLGQIEARPLAGTAGGEYLFWSPGSDQIGFVRDGTLWRVPAQGGEPSTIALSVGAFTPAAGVRWGNDGKIVFSRGSTGLFEVSSRGGEPHTLLELDETDSDHHQPSLLPDGQGVIFVAHRIATAPDTIRVLDDEGVRDVLQIPNERLANPVYAPSGHIIYRRSGTRNGLWAVPFSLSSRQTEGEPFLLTPDGSHPSVAADGSLVYVVGADAGQRQLVWVNRDGSIAGSVGQPQTRIASPAIAPDGRRIAVMAQENENWDIWIHDAERGTRTRLTFNATMDWDPAWSPDGERLIYWDGATRAISMKAADGTGDTTRLVAETLADSGNAVLTPDGTTMVFWSKGTSFEDIWLMPLEGGERVTRPLISTAAREDFPGISPDGRSLVYVSDESGRDEIFLSRFPTPEGKWQVSVNGGNVPRWGPRGDRIYFLEGTRMMEVDVTTESGVRLGTPRMLFDGAEAGVETAGFSRYDVAPDGERFIMVKRLRQEGEVSSIVLVQNWHAEFQARD